MNTKTKIIIIAVTILILAGAAGGYYFQQKNKLVVSDVLINLDPLEAKRIPEEIQAPQPEKSDFGTSLPAEFPSDIPIEKDAAIEQSYGLSYEGQKQLSIVFVSEKTVKENFDLYKDFLEKQSWRIINENESENFSFLYGSKEQNDINVTIGENASTATSKSQVSISVLKK